MQNLHPNLGESEIVMKETTAAMRGAWWMVVLAASALSPVMAAQAQTIGEGQLELE